MSSAKEVSRDGLICLRLRSVGDALRSWEPLFWIAASLLAALILPVRFEIGQNADGLLQTLMSLQHLTVFFWEQDRFANLLPLLTCPITDPTANAEAQLAIRIVLGLAAPLLFCAPIMRNGNYLHIARTSLLATSLALAFAPHRFVREWFIEASPYGTSFALSGFALLLFDVARSRDNRSATVFRLFGLLLTILAYLVNASLVLFSGPLFAMLAVTRGSPLAVEFGIASIIGAIATATVASSVAIPHTAMHFGETFIGLTYYLGRLSEKPGIFLGAMCAAFVLAIGVGRATRWPERHHLLSDGAILLTTFVVGFLAISLSSWVIANYLHPRYLVPLYILASSLGAISISALFDSVVPSAALRSRMALCLCLALLLVAGRRSLPPVPSDNSIVDASIRPAAAAAASEIIRLKLDGIAGDYWTVWPTVFSAEQLAHDLGQRPGRIFGVSYRGTVRREALRTRLLAQGSLDIACLDLVEAQCHELINAVVGTPLLIDHTLQTRRYLVDGHRISVVRLLPSVIEESGKQTGDDFDHGSTPILR